MGAVARGLSTPWAFVALETRGLVDLGGSAVIGVAGTSGLQAPAGAAWSGPVTIWPDGDGPGRLEPGLGVLHRHSRHAVHRAATG